MRRTEFLWALAAFAGVVLLGTLQGILVAVAISLLTLFYAANHPLFMLWDGSGHGRVPATVRR